MGSHFGSRHFEFAYRACVAFPVFAMEAAALRLAAYAASAEGVFLIGVAVETGAACVATTGLSTVLCDTLSKSGAWSSSASATDCGHQRSDNESFECATSTDSK